MYNVQCLWGHSLCENISVILQKGAAQILNAMPTWRCIHERCLSVSHSYSHPRSHTYLTDVHAVVSHMRTHPPTGRQLQKHTHTHTRMHAPAATAWLACECCLQHPGKWRKRQSAQEDEWQAKAAGLDLWHFGATEAWTDLERWTGLRCYREASWLPVHKQCAVEVWREATQTGCCTGSTGLGLWICTVWEGQATQGKGDCFSRPLFWWDSSTGSYA